MFYEYYQNNSGGSFIMNDDVAHFVFIEADSAKEADARAEEIGIYFDDNFDVDCECCGTRWSYAYGGEETPMIYDKPVEEYVDMWTPEGKAYAYVYYKDGTKRSYTREGANQ
jgi:hypothetical protein